MMFYFTGKISDVIPSTPSKRQVSLLHYYRSPSVEHSNAKVTNEHNTPPSSKSNETIRGEEIAVVRDLDGFCEENGSLLTESPLNEDSEFASSEHQKRCSVSKGLWPIHYGEWSLKLNVNWQRINGSIHDVVFVVLIVNEKKKLDCSSADKQVSKEPIRFTNITSKCHRSSQKALSRNVDNKEQLIIDAGQKTIGARMCHECGMLYSANCDEDTFLHVRIHNHLLLTLRFTVSKLSFKMMWIDKVAVTVII